MRAQLLLADSAQADPAGKVHALGLGWSQTGSPTDPMALIAMIEIEPDEFDSRAESEWQCAVVLVDEMGQPVHLQTESGVSELRIFSTLRARQREETPVGTPMIAPLVINFGPLPLPPDHRYAWQLTLDDDPGQRWSVQFTTHPRSAGQLLGSVRT